MSSPNGVAADVVEHVGRFGCDERFFDLMSVLRNEIGGDPNDVLPVLREAGLAQALTARAERLELSNGDPVEIRRLREKAACVNAEHLPESAVRDSDEPLVDARIQSVSHQRARMGFART